MIKNFVFNPSEKDKAASEILNFIQETLRNFKIKTSEENRIMLMFEESLLSLVNNLNSDKEQTIKVSLRRFLDTMNIEITVPGKEFSFAEKISGFNFQEENNNEEIQETVQNLLLRSFGNRLKYKHKKGLNSVKIEAIRSPYSFLYKTLEAVFLAVILGLVCRQFAICS